jgi:PAS domain S-box-containing protein
VRDSDILGRLPEGMLLVSRAGELLSFNATAESLLGVGLEPLRGRAILSNTGVFPLGAGNAPLAKLVADAGEERSVSMSEVAVRTAGGQSLLLEITVQHREWGANSTALVLLFRDASEKQRIRDEIRRADQLAFLGGLAARVAHEIRTPLAAIRGLVELMEDDAPGQARDEYMARILQAVDRQDKLVENLLALTHPEPESCQAVSVAVLMADVVGMMPRDPRLSFSEDPRADSAWRCATRGAASRPICATGSSSRSSRPSRRGRGSAWPSRGRSSTRTRAASRSSATVSRRRPSSSSCRRRLPRDRPRGWRSHETSRWLSGS